MYSEQLLPGCRPNVCSLYSTFPLVEWISLNTNWNNYRFRISRLSWLCRSVGCEPIWNRGSLSFHGRCNIGTYIRCHCHTSAYLALLILMDHGNCSLICIRPDQLNSKNAIPQSHFGVTTFTKETLALPTFHVFRKRRQFVRRRRTRFPYTFPP